MTRGGYLPALTPAHQADRLTGIGPFGPMIEESLTNPVSGKFVGESGSNVASVSFNEDRMPSETAALAEFGLVNPNSDYHGSRLC